MQNHQHVIDWWKSQGYIVHELTGGQLMCLTMSVYAQMGVEEVNYQLSRHLTAMHRKRS